MYPIYATVCKDTECPYTCALFINYLLSEEGFAGEKSWNSSQGYYSPNTSIQKPEGLEDKPFEYWQDKLVLEDLDYLYEHYIDSSPLRGRPEGRPCSSSFLQSGG